MVFGHYEPRLWVKHKGRSYPSQPIVKVPAWDRHRYALFLVQTLQLCPTRLGPPECACPDEHDSALVVRHETCLCAGWAQASNPLTDHITNLTARRLFPKRLDLDFSPVPSCIVCALYLVTKPVPTLDHVPPPHNSRKVRGH